jgi:hypothetical protein
MAAFEAGRPNLALCVQDLASHPEALCWAAVCAWVPGTGYCRNRDCSEACLLRAQCEADAARVRRWRRLRRIFGRRPGRG